MKESVLMKYYYYIYSVIGYIWVAFIGRFKKRNSHDYFIDSKTLIDIYNQYGLINIIRALYRVPQNLNLSTTGLKLFKNAYFPKVKKTVLSTSIEITNNCPYRCKGCYISLSKKKSSYFMTEDILRKTIQDYSHSTFILIQGGEPLQKNSVDILYNVFKDYPEQIFVIVTTGVYLSKYGIGKFKNLNNILWSISLNGTEKINDEIRFKGSFKHALNAMDEIRKVQQYFVATVTLSKDNIKDATSEKFISLLANKGVKEIRYLILRDNTSNQLSLEEIEFYENVTKKYNKYLFCNFCIDSLEDYSVIDPYGEKRMDRTGKDHTLKYEQEKFLIKHYF